MQPFAILASEAIGAVIIGGGLILGAMGIISCTVKRLYSEKQREQSRREIAAYIAERLGISRTRPANRGKPSDELEPSTPSYHGATRREPRANAGSGGHKTPQVEGMDRKD